MGLLLGVFSSQGTVPRLTVPQPVNRENVKTISIPFFIANDLLFTPVNIMGYAYF
jgi:hypothetical protein